MPDITGTVKSVSEAFKSLFDCAAKTKDRQAETQIIKDKKRLKKATNIAQEIFTITDGLKSAMSEDERERYEKLRKQFDKKD